MPNLDGTGPEGKGPKTGRQQGRCGNKSSIENNTTENNVGFSKGLGRKLRRNTNQDGGLGRKNA